MMSPYVRRLRERVGTEVLMVPSASAVVRDDSGAVLLVRKIDGGQWVIPGGGLDPWETPADAAVRETWEEAGLLVEPVRILGVYGGPECGMTYGNGDLVNYTMTVFECRAVGGEARGDGVETAEARFFGKAQLEGLPLPEWMRLVLPAAFATGGARFQPARWRPE